MEKQFSCFIKYEGLSRIVNFLLMGKIYILQLLLVLKHFERNGKKKPFNSNLVDIRISCLMDGKGLHSAIHC